MSSTDDNLKTGSDFSIKAFDNFLRDVSKHVEKAERLEIENSVIQMELTSIRADNLQKQVKINELSEKVNRLQKSELKNSKEEHKELESVTKESTLINECMRLSFDLEQVESSKSND